MIQDVSYLLMTLLSQEIIRSGPLLSLSCIRVPFQGKTMKYQVVIRWCLLLLVSSNRVKLTVTASQTTDAGWLYSDAEHAAAAVSALTTKERAAAVFSRYLVTYSILIPSPCVTTIYHLVFNNITRTLLNPRAPAGVGIQHHVVSTKRNKGLLFMHID